MADFSQAFTNAATGVGIGSAGGVPGMVAGGALGFLSGLTGFGGDTEDEVMNYERYTPEQREYMKKIRDAAEGGNLEAIEFLKKIVSQDPEAFKDFERPYMEQFEQQTVPNILERINAGGGQNKYSSGVQQSLAQAGRGLSTDLASLRAKLGMQAGQELRAYGQQGLQEQQTPYVKKGKEGYASQAQPAAGAAFSKWLSSLTPQDATDFMNQFKRGI